MVFLKKLKNRYIWRQILHERLTEPLHLNLAALGVALFGGFRARVAFDLVIRHHNAFCILQAADQARRLGIGKIPLLEFGVASGAGLLNMATIAKRVTAVTWVEFVVVGFDSGRGMPPAQDYRDHPEVYQQGDFETHREELEKLLLASASLVIGDIAETVPEFVGSLAVSCPIGYDVMDVDYYSSAKAALKVFESRREHYLPVTYAYLDDIRFPVHNAWCGERLAVREFNEEHPLRKIEHHPFLEHSRIFRRAGWIKHVYYLHVLDHPWRNNTEARRDPVSLTNPYKRGIERGYREKGSR